MVLVVPVIAGFLISGMVEFTQRSIYGRVPSLLDLAYNVLGVIIGSGLVWMGLRNRRTWK